ncbi:MAG TPA: 3-phosphoshikimate 1-carboxyvinyltransferase [Solirubrobacterales bacterium]|jgi:3-phosphoshikimate 1-carboxyvinyltransferase|nr:3-phosphoshikimate 1-carboxyvinyltransferase [Solirubrobacterales bacterium]
MTDPTRFDPLGPLRGALRPPADKSISHRAAMIAAMGEGETEVVGYLDAADTRSTLAAVAAVGARLVAEDTGPAAVGTGDGLGAPHLLISGVGLRGARSADIDVGNAGTLLRLLPGWLAGQPQGRWILDGDASIRRRPVDRIAEPLGRMGARLRPHAENRLPPLEIEAAPLDGITYELPIASAQVKSCLLFAALLAAGETRVVEPLPTRDHTERMLAAAGAEVRRDGDVIVVAPAERLEPGRIVVPADFSSAAFFIVAATIVPGSDVLLHRVGLNPTRTGLLDILRRMGAEGIEVTELSADGGEPIGDIRVAHSALHGCEVGGADVPLAIDELPLVALAACFAEGATTIGDAVELRRKESDRIATVTDALRALGGSVEPTEDGMAIEGTGGLRGGAIDSHGDHRIAMLGAVAGVASRGGVEVAGMDAAAVSYPGFETDLGTLRHGPPPRDPVH